MLLAASVFAAETPTALWIDVPFAPEPREGCGAASLAMLMQYWAGKQGQPTGEDSRVDTIQHALYSPKEHGISAARMQEYLQQHGYRVFTLSAEWNDLEVNLRKGRPLIVAVRPDGQRELHYVVLDGIDTEHALITMNDPGIRKFVTEERAQFEKEWSATHNWMLLAVPSPALR